MKTMCRVLGVSVGGYYAWKKHPQCERKRQDEKMSQQLREAYQASYQTYGSPRLRAQLAEQGISCGRKRIARLMRAQGMSAKVKKRRVQTTDSQHSNPVADNLLDQNFTASQPNEKWVGDITSIATVQGWLYLAVVLDLYSRQVVGWSMSATRDGALVENALSMALARRHPEHELLHHSDRGSQYTSRQFQERLKAAGIEASMSRKGNCYDNAAMESFFGTLKTEWVDRYRYITHEEARTSIFVYIETFYNRKRRHSTLEYLSPIEYEKRKNNDIACYS